MTSVLDGLDPARDPQHPSARALEEWAFQPEDASTSESATARHLAACPDCRKAVETLRVEREAFLALRPAPAFVERVLASAPPSPWERLRELLSLPRLLGAGAALSMAVLALVLAPRLLGGDGGDEVRLRGAQAPVLKLLAGRVGGTVSPLPAGATLTAGDVLRFEVVLARPAHVQVVNLDDRGVFTRYYPVEGASGLLPAGRHLLPGSIVLDDFVGRERISVVAAPQPIDEGRVREALLAAFAASGLEAMADPAGDWQWASVLLTKRAP